MDENGGNILTENGNPIFSNSNSAGHSKGTTEKKKRTEKQNYQNCVASICKIYRSELTKTDRKHLPKNYLDNLIKRKKKEYNMTETILKGTVQKCLQ